MKKILSILFILCFLSVFSQEETVDAPILSLQQDESPAVPKQYYVFSPRVSVTVPHPIANEAFRQSFVGVYEVSGGLNINVFKGIFVGAFYKNGLLKITENKIPDFEARMSINNAGIKFGTDVYIGDKNRIIFSGSLAAGQNYTNYSGLRSKQINKQPELTSYSTSFLEPELNLFFLVEQNFGIGLSVTYTLYNKEFNPYELSLNDWQSFNKENPGRTQYLSFGFGFYYSFLKKGKRVK